MLVLEMMPWTSGIQICCQKLCGICRRHMASLGLNELSTINASCIVTGAFAGMMLTYPIGSIVGHSNPAQLYDISFSEALVEWFKF